MTNEKKTKKSIKQDEPDKGVIAESNPTLVLHRLTKPVLIQRENVSYYVNLPHRSSEQLFHTEFLLRTTEDRISLVGNTSNYDGDEMMGYKQVFPYRMSYSYGKAASSGVFDKFENRSVTLLFYDQKSNRILDTVPPDHWVTYRSYEKNFPGLKGDAAKWEVYPEPYSAVASQVLNLMIHPFLFDNNQELREHVLLESTWPDLLLELAQLRNDIREHTFQKQIVEVVVSTITQIAHLKSHQYSRLWLPKYTEEKTISDVSQLRGNTDFIQNPQRLKLDE
jgi:hypothetical protein